jgi:hypothetical protein
MLATILPPQFFTGSSLPEGNGARSAAPPLVAFSGRSPATSPVVGALSLSGGLAVELAQALTGDATLETRQAVVQWSAIGSTAWVTVPERQAVSVGDRIRTGPGASARLVYFEGTVIEVAAETGLLVQRLERSPDDGLITRLYQAAGTTLSRVMQLVEPAAQFEVETPAATAFVRGTELETREWLGPVGGPAQFLFQNRTTPVGGNPVEVCGLSTSPVVAEHAETGRCATILGGQEILASADRGLGPVVPLGFTDQQGQRSTSDGQASSAPSQQQERRERERALAEAQVAQARAALVASQLEAERLAQQERALLDQIRQLLAAGTIGPRISAQGSTNRESLTMAAITGTPTPTPRLSGSPSPTLSRTPASTAIATPTATTVAPGNTATPTSLPSSTPTPAPTGAVTATPILSFSPTPISTATPTSVAPPLPTPTVTSTASATPSPTSTGTPVPTPTATATAVSGPGCISAGTACRVILSPPEGPTARGLIETGPCVPGAANCLQFTSSPDGFRVQGVITGAGGRVITVDIPVVDAQGTAQGTRAIGCSPGQTPGRATCDEVIPAVFPQLDGQVLASR